MDVQIVFIEIFFDTFYISYKSGIKFSRIIYLQMFY